MSRPDRLDVMERVLSCTGCDLHKTGNGPVAFSGPKENPNGIAILGEAPGRQEDSAGEPFIGPAGELLRMHLREVGITPERCFIINTVSCWPNGTPKPEHVQACSGNKAAQLAIAAPRWVLVLGKVAMTAVRPGLRIATARGKPFRPGNQGPVHMVTYHPAAALRKGAFEQAMRKDLELFIKVCRSGEEWGEHLVNQCWECNSEYPVWFDIDGIAWCDKHAPQDYLDRMTFLDEVYREAKRRLEVGGVGLR